MRIFFSTAKGRSNHFDDTNRVSEHISVPKPKYAVTALFQVCGSIGIVHFCLIVSVPATVKLDQQVFRSASKVLCMGRSGIAV
jgi:hypothetical protein